MEIEERYHAMAAQQRAQQRGGLFAASLAAQQQAQQAPSNRVWDDVLNQMRAEGDRFPNLGEAGRRLESRKKVVSRVLTPQEAVSAAAKAVKATQMKVKLLKR